MMTLRKAFGPGSGILGVTRAPFGTISDAKDSQPRRQVVKHWRGENRIANAPNRQFAHVLPNRTAAEHLRAYETQGFR